MLFSQFHFPLLATALFSFQLNSSKCRLHLFSPVPLPFLTCFNQASFITLKWLWSRTLMNSIKWNQWSILRPSLTLSILTQLITLSNLKHWLQETTCLVLLLLACSLQSSLFTYCPSYVSPASPWSLYVLVPQNSAPQSAHHGLVLVHKPWWVKHRIWQ